MEPARGSFDPMRMSRGEPGVPESFRWRGKEIKIVEVLETWKEFGDCRHGSGERYVRKHGFRLKTSDGAILNVYFQRSFGRGRMTKDRWWLRSIEEK